MQLNRGSTSQLASACVATPCDLREDVQTLALELLQPFFLKKGGG